MTSRLDVGNRLPFKQIQRLQRVQNWAARLVVRTTKFCRATLLLGELHWMLTAVRVEFKTLLLIHRAVNGRAPDYVANWVTDVCRLDRCARVNLICFVSRELNGIGETGRSASQPRHYGTCRHNVNRAFRRCF